MTLVGFAPGMQVIDPRTGYLTREGSQLIQFIVNAVNGAGSVLVADGSQTLTGKTISGDANELTDIPTSALKQKTGGGSNVVTAATLGEETAGTLAVWSNGNLSSGPGAEEIVTTDIGDARYVSGDGSTETAGPINLASYTVAGVPPAADFPNSFIYVSNEAGGAVAAFSDGTNWRRVTDRATIS